MPVYEYQCNTCGQHFDIRQSFADVPLTICPNCGNKIHRVIQPAGIVFKGSGFYVTDSRGKQNLSTSGEKKTTDSSHESGSDSGASKEAPAAESASVSNDGKSDGTKADSAKADSVAKPAESVAASSSASSSNGSAADKK